MSQPEAETRCAGGRRASAKIVVPGDSNELSHNKRLHWRAEHKLKQKWRGNTLLIASLARIEPFSGRVRISFIVRRPRLLDPDNARSSAALKAILDSVVQAGIIRGDTATLVELGPVTQEKAKEPEVEIILEEIE